MSATANLVREVGEQLLMFWRQGIIDRVELDEYINQLTSLKNIREVEEFMVQMQKTLNLRVIDKEVERGNLTQQEGVKLKAKIESALSTRGMVDIMAEVLTLGLKKKGDHIAPEELVETAYKDAAAELQQRDLEAERELALNALNVEEAVESYGLDEVLVKTKKAVEEAKTIDEIELAMMVWVKEGGRVTIERMTELSLIGDEQKVILLKQLEAMQTPSETAGFMVCLQQLPIVMLSLVKKVTRMGLFEEESIIEAMLAVVMDLTSSLEVGIMRSDLTVGVRPTGSYFYFVLLEGEGRLLRPVRTYKVALRLKKYEDEPEGEGGGGPILH